METDRIRDRCMPNGDLKIKCQIRFYGSYIHDEFCSDSKATDDRSRLSVINDLSGLLESPKFSDVQLLAGDRRFQAHKVILATRSPVFSAMFDSPMKERKENVAEITDVEPDRDCGRVAALHLHGQSQGFGICADGRTTMAAADKERARRIAQSLKVDKLCSAISSWSNKDARVVNATLDQLQTGDRPHGKRRKVHCVAAVETYG